MEDGRFWFGVVARPTGRWPGGDRFPKAAALGYSRAPLRGKWGACVCGLPGLKIETWGTQCTRISPMYEDRIDGLPGLSPSPV